MGITMTGLGAVALGAGPSDFLSWHPTMKLAPTITTASVVRMSSYECGMDQPTYTPTQKIVEATGTLYFKFGDLDATKPAGSINIRIETIIHYLEKYSGAIIRRKLASLPPLYPFLKA